MKRFSQQRSPGDFSNRNWLSQVFLGLGLSLGMATAALAEVVAITLLHLVDT